ncbi:MAG TPA: hypothetical protein VNK44_04950 [Candidatus Nitrosotenuis sp.]|nr:hypothetical protein [Candidatus Nitrosotenuis sp.]
MEVAIILSSIAGAATAATINRFPKKGKTPLLGANSQIRAQIETLRIEKDILTKTISRLYSDGGELTKIQRDKLLSRYQHQLGVILAKIEKLEEASKYPDLGPLGDGLMSLMDQKLSALDKRLAEISSRISVAAQVQLEKPKVEKEESKKESRIEKEKPVPVEKPEVVSSESIEEMIRSFAKPAKKLELTTLTEIPPVVLPDTIVQPVQTPQIQTPPMQVPASVQQVVPPTEMREVIQPQKPVPVEPIDIEKQIRSEPPKLEFRDEPKPEIEKKKPKLNIPEPVEAEEDEDDLDSIKREIMKTLSKLEQAEVE